jgi:hypothetical protein
LHLQIHGFQAPEAAAGECRNFELAHGLIDASRLGAATRIC